VIESLTQVNISQADDGLKRFSAAVVTAPNDLTNGAWTKVQCAGTTATQIVTDVGVATTYYVQQISPGWNANRPGQIIFDIKAGTVGYLAAVDISGNWLVYLNATTGAVVSSAGTGVATAMGAVGGGWFRFRVDISGTNSAQVLFLASPNGVTYTWSSLGGDTVGVTGVSGSQNIAIYQPTAANRPALEQDSAGRFYMHGDGVNDNLSGLFVIAQPDVVAWTGQLDALASKYLWDGSAVNTFGAFCDASDTTLTGIANVGLAGTVDVLTTTSAVAVTYNGASGEVWQTGRRRASGNIGAVAQGGFTLMSSGSPSAWSASRVYESAIFDGILPDCYHARYANMAAKRWGAAHA
jgi:hypothetical protein